jgi:hypothetical protein
MWGHALKSEGEHAGPIKKLAGAQRALRAGEEEALS